MDKLIRMPLDPAQVRQRRDKLQLTLQEAADRANAAATRLGLSGKFTRQRWHDIEHGRVPDPRLSTLELLAAVLGCTLDALRSPPQPKSPPR